MSYPRGKRWFTSGTLITPEEVVWPASTLTAQMGSKDRHFVISQLAFTSQDLQQNVQHLSVTEVQHQCWRGHFKRRMSRWGELFINPDQLLRQNFIHFSSDTRLSSAGSGRASTEEPLPLQYSVAILGACGVGKTTLKMKFMSSKHETEGANVLYAQIEKTLLFWENSLLCVRKRCFKNHFTLLYFRNTIMLYF